MRGRSRGLAETFGPVNPKTTLLAIFTCEAHKDKLAAQQATWIPEVVSRGYDVEVFDGTRLGIDDSRAGLAEKTRAICRWATSKPYQSLAKIDDDVYIHTDRFVEYADDYVGSRIHPQNGNADFAYGFLYYLSRRAFTYLAQSDISPGITWEEDQWVGNRLSAAGIPLTDISQMLCTSIQKSGSGVMAIGQLETAHRIWEMHDARHGKIAAPPSAYGYHSKRTK